MAQWFDINLQDITTNCIIGEGAFQNHNDFASIEISNSVVQIGKGAFRNCTNLTSITLPFVGQGKDSEETFWYIFDMVDENDQPILPDQLTTVNITGDIETIPNNAFKGMDKLINISLPTSLKKIGSEAFYNTSVVNLTIPDGVVELGESAFKGMSSLKTVSWYTKEYKWRTNSDYVATIYFDEDFVSGLLSNTQIYGYQYITNASTEENIYYGTEKFTYDGGKHTKKENDPSLVVVQTDTSKVVAFAPIFSRFFLEYEIHPIIELQGNCGDNLTYVIEPFINEEGQNKYKVTIDGYGDMFDYEINEEKMLISTPWYDFREDIVELQLPDGISSVGNYAFANLVNVTKIVLPQTISRIGSYAFSHCENARFSDLREGYEPNLLRLLSLKVIERNAFEYCYLLESFNCEAGLLEQVDRYAFRNCLGLRSVRLPNKDIYLEESIFFNCDNMESLYLPISSDIGKGIKNDFSEFPNNYRKYNIGCYFQTYRDEKIVMKEKEGIETNTSEPENIEKYITYNCWFTGVSYHNFNTGVDTPIRCSDNISSIQKIDNLYFPRTLKDITICKGIMPQFYLYNGSDGDSYWERVSVEQKVTDTIHFVYSSETCTEGFNNTTVVQSKEGLLVGVIANVIEIFDVSLATFCSLEGLLGFYSKQVEGSSSGSFGDIIDRNKTKSDSVMVENVFSHNNENYWYRKKCMYSYSSSYKEIICKGIYKESFVQYSASGIAIEKLDLTETSLVSLSNSLFNQSMAIVDLYLPKTVKEIERLNVQGINSYSYSTSYLNIQNIHGHEDGEITTLASNAFQNNTVLQQFNCKIKSNSIPQGVFSGCTNLTQIKEIEGNNIQIGVQAFDNCKNLRTLNFSENSDVSLVRYRAFYNCQALQTSFPCVSNGLRVEGQAFYNCYNIKFVCSQQEHFLKIKAFLGSGEDSNNKEHFAGCNKLQKIELDSAITSVPIKSFYGCGKLNSVRIPDSVSIIGQYAFWGYTGEWIELPQLRCLKQDTNEELDGTLSYILGTPVSTLKEVYISNSITIPNYAFKSWTGLTHVYLKPYKEGGKINLNSNNFNDYFTTTSIIPWNSDNTSFTIQGLNASYVFQEINFVNMQENIFSFEWLFIPSTMGMFRVFVNGMSIKDVYPDDMNNEQSGREQILLKKEDKITFYIYNRYPAPNSSITISTMCINDEPLYSTTVFEDTQTTEIEPYPTDLPWEKNVSGGNRRILSSPFALTKDTNRCLYLDYDKEYLWKLLLYGKQHDVYITDNNTYTEQYSYLPKLYTPNHNGIEVGQHIELQGENTYEIIDTQLFKYIGQIYYRQSQGVVNGKISYYSVSSGTLTYNPEQETYEVDESLKNGLSSQPIEFSTGSTYEQSMYKGKIRIVNNNVFVELAENVINKEFEYGAQIALKNVVVQKANLKTELFSAIQKGSQFVVANSNQLQTVTNIDEFYEITMEPGFNVNTTGYNEIQVTLTDASSRILPNDINNNEVVVVVKTKGNLLIEGSLNEEVKKGIIDEHLISLIDIEKETSTHFKLEGIDYTITDVDVLNNTIYFKDKENKGYIVSNQISYDHEIQLEDYRDLVTDNGFDTTDLHLTLNYINIFEINSIKKYTINNDALSRENFKLEDGEELYLIGCKETVGPTNYEVASRDLEKEAIIERYSTILTVETLEGETPQHVLVSPNTNYYIYSNNIKTPPYYFETLKKKDIKVIYKGEEVVDTIEMDCGSGLFEATYEDNIASCTWSLQELYEGEYIEIDKVVNQYSPNLFYNYHLFNNNTSYRLTVTIATQDGLIITKDIDIVVAYDPQLDIVQVTVEKDCEKQAIKINLQDIGLKIKDLSYNICPRSWLEDTNAIYKIDSLYVIRENLDEPSEKAVIAQVQGFPKYIYDYSFQREDTYKYSILPIYHSTINPSELIRGVPSVIEEPIRFNLKTIVLVGTEMDLRENIPENDLLANNYQIDKQPFSKWYFKYNTDARNVNIVTDKTVFETISPFATVNYSARNYKTGTVTAFLGAYHKNELNSDWTYKDSIRLQNKLQEFANNGKIKMLRDEIGNVIPVDITLKSFEYNSHTIPTNITVSFEWTQIDTEKNFTVFEVEYDEQLEKMRKENKLPNYINKYNA